MAHLSVCQASLSTRVLIPGTQGGKKLSLGFYMYGSVTKDTHILILSYTHAKNKHNDLFM